MTGKKLTFLMFTCLCVAIFAEGQSSAPPGVKEVQRNISMLPRVAVINLGGDPDWMAIGEDAVWISNEKHKSVFRIDPRTNRIVARVRFADPPCSGLALGFGSLWVPICGKRPSLARVDVKTNRMAAILPAGPGDDEGGITAGGGSVWIVDGESELLRIDPERNAIAQKIALPPGSHNPLFAERIVWVTGNRSNQLTPVDAATGAVLPAIPVGPKPRFLAVGAGSIWTLNQGDGSITRVNAKTKTAEATIPAGIPGNGGEIAFGANSVWATVFRVPLTRVDPKSNQIVRQWLGAGGDSVRFGFDSIWLTDLKAGQLWRIALRDATGP